jgi:hypothetical protein
MLGLIPTFDGRERPDSPLSCCVVEFMKVSEFGTGFQELMITPVSSSLSSLYRVDV